MWIPILLRTALDFHETLRIDLAEHEIFSSVPFAVDEDVNLVKIQFAF